MGTPNIAVPNLDFFTWGKLVFVGVMVCKMYLTLVAEHHFAFSGWWESERPSKLKSL